MQDTQLTQAEIYSAQAEEILKGPGFLTKREYDSLPPIVRNVLELRVRQSGRSQTFEDLKRQLAMCIHIACINVRPMKMASANRLFSMQAKRLGHTFREMVDDLTTEGILVQHLLKGSTVLMTTAFDTDRCEMIKEHNKLLPVGHAVSFHEALKVYLENAQ